MNSIIFVSLMLLAFGADLLMTMPSNFTYGGFMFYYNQSIYAQDAYEQLPFSRDCECRLRCTDDPKCQSYSWVSRGDFVNCRFSALNSGTLVRQMNPVATFASKFPQNAFLGGDGMYYYFIPQMLSYPDAVSACSSFNNFQVGTYKTVDQFQILFKVYLQMNEQPIWTSLQAFVNPVRAIWPDGTLFTDTELGKSGNVNLITNDGVAGHMHRLFNGALNDWYPNIQYFVLCQGNLTIG